MIGITIGVGTGWFDCALRASDRMREMTGLECKVMQGFGDHSHASWFKHRILKFYEGDEFLYFDADIICLKPWNPKEIFEKNGRKLCAVRDNNPEMGEAVRLEELALGIPENTYLNAGLFMFGGEHAKLFESVWSMRPAFHRWIDQSAFNYCLYKLGVQVAVLPSEYNCMSYNFTERNSSINWHVHSLDGSWWKLRSAQESILGAACSGPSPSVAPTK